MLHYSNGSAQENSQSVKSGSQDVKLTRSLVMVYNGNMEMVVKGVKMLLILTSDG